MLSHKLDRKASVRLHRQYKAVGRFIVGGCIAAYVGWTLAATQAHAQVGSNTQFYSPFRDEIAEQQLLQRSVAATALAPQPYMREMFWGFRDDTPAFFRDSLM